MKNQRLLLALTLVNFGLLAFQLIRPRRALAQEAPGILRGRALEIVDEGGKVRAELRVFPVNPKYKLANGDPYPETVLLRLIDPNGRPSVKIQATVRGGGLYFGGAQDPTGAQLGAEGAQAKLKLTNQDRKERLIEP